MDAMQQHMLDTYRAACLGEPAPPPPGRHDRRTLRDLYHHWLTHPPTENRPARHRSGPSGPSGA
ncbi:hypothetical protein [Streptomyces microflavus]|uniref:hypothetical protein n=1 Tax=Streptomyces microflavus TaxID=1919 RepID=UPI002E330F95|nr:hypothetical protein [Streptomyces microflavus]